MNVRLEDFTDPHSVEALEAEVEACFEIIETLPVGAHDMDVHFWCNRDRGCEEEDED